MAQARKTFIVTATVSVLVLLTMAQQHISPGTCANPGGFSTCYQQAASVFLTCSAHAGADESKQLVCECESHLAEIDCALESCWNVVYGCEYQRLAFTWDTVCLGTLGDIPYFPAPEAAPGGCSCNLGQLVSNYTNVNDFYTSCTEKTSDIIACGCCLLSGEITSVYSLCPNDNPSALGLSDVEMVLLAEASNPSACAPSFEQYDCVKDLGFPAIGALPYLTAIPSITGTLSPSTTGGSITTPLCGTECVLVVGGTSTVITPLEATTASNSGKAGSSSQSSNSASTFRDVNAKGWTSKKYGFLGLHLLLMVFAIAHLT